MSALAIEITSERTALVSGAGAHKVELSADAGQSIHAVIAQYSRTHSAAAGTPVEVLVQEAGRSRQLTVAPDGKVSQSLPTGPIPTPPGEPDPASAVAPSLDDVEEPVTMSMAPIGHPPATDETPRRADTHADVAANPLPRNEYPPAPNIRADSTRSRPVTSVLSAPEITPGTREPARAGIRGRLNTVLNLRMAPKRDSAEMRQRTAVAAITGPIPGFSIVTVANPKGGVGKTPLAVGLNAVIAQHRGVGSTVCADVSEVAGSLADRISVPPRPGQDVIELVAAVAAETGSVSPSTLSRYLTRQPNGDDIVAGAPHTAERTGLRYDDAHTLATTLAQHREILIADTGNNRLAGSWQWAVTAANVLVVPVPLRRDAAAAAHRMLLDLAAATSPDAATRTIVVITDGPGDAPMVETEAVDAFLDLGVHAVLRMPFESLFAAGERIAAHQLRRATIESLTVIAAEVITLITNTAD